MHAPKKFKLQRTEVKTPHDFYFYQQFVIHNSRHFLCILLEKTEKGVWGELHNRLQLRDGYISVCLIIIYTFYI